MKLRPIHDNVLIRPIDEHLTTPSGIELIEYWRPRVLGTVEAVGRGSKCRICQSKTPSPVTEGDVVVFPYTAGETITLDDEDFLMIQSRDILAILSKEHAQAVAPV